MKGGDIICATTAMAWSPSSSSRTAIGAPSVGDGIAPAPSSPMLSGMLPMDNAFFSGGMGLAVVGALAQLARRGAGLVQVLARRHLLMTLEVTSKDASYPWVLNWLSRQGRRTQHLTVSTVQQLGRDGVIAYRFDKVGADPAVPCSWPKALLIVVGVSVQVPGPGRHVIRHDNRSLRRLGFRGRRRRPWS